MISQAGRLVNPSILKVRRGLSGFSSSWHEQLLQVKREWAAGRIAVLTLYPLSVRELRGEDLPLFGVLRSLNPPSGCGDI
jgi:hypothetical protein